MIGEQAAVMPVEAGMGMQPGGEPGELREVCVPLAALQVTDEAGGASAPAVGDQVSAQMDGVVSRIEGDCVYVQARAFNGAPADGTAAHENAETPEQEAAETAGGEGGEDPELAKLRKQARGMGGL